MCSIMHAQIHKEWQTYQLQYIKTNWIGLQEFGKCLKGKTGYFVHLNSNFNAF